MKGKNNFTEFEKKELREIIKKYENSNSQTEKKNLRAKMRKIGFYMSNYGLSNITLNDFNKLFPSSKNVKSISKKNIEKKINPEKSNLKFTKFDPLTDNPLSIPNDKGNYLILLKKGSKLPNINSDYICKTYKGKDVIYTGISNKSLRNRDFKQHFNGTAGNSTLRKSIGSMFGWKKIPRDKIENGKTKFSKQDEEKLSNWMKNNLELHYNQNSNPIENEEELINKYNPPLNLSKNKNIINLEFRKKLSQLRKK